MRLPLLIAALAPALLPIAVEAHDASEAKYLRNEGVLVTRGNSKILFDAFYAESFQGHYTLIPASLESAMMEGKAPFDGIDAIFISHIHPDHFNSRKTIAYLRAHPEVRLFAGLDVAGAIKAADVAADDPLLKRVTPINLIPRADPVRFEVGGLEVEAFPIPHSGGNPVPNHVYRVTLDRMTTVMHLGDAASDEKHYVGYQPHFDRKKTHVAFAPLWMLQDPSGKRVLEQRIRPAKVIGIHVPEEARREADKARREAGADLFIEPGETRPMAEQQR